MSSLNSSVLVLEQWNKKQTEKSGVGFVKQSSRFLTVTNESWLILKFVEHFWQRS